MNQVDDITVTFLPDFVFEYFDNRYMASVKEITLLHENDASSIIYTVKLTPAPFENENDVIKLRRIFRNDASWTWWYGQEPAHIHDGLLEAVSHAIDNYYTAE